MEKECTLLSRVCRVTYARLLFPSVLGELQLQFHHAEMTDKQVRNLEPTLSSLLPSFLTQTSKFSTNWLSPKKLAALFFFLKKFPIYFFFPFLKRKWKCSSKIQTQPQPNQGYQTLGKLGWMTRVFQRNLFCMEVNFKHFSSLPDDLILDEPMKAKALQRRSNYFASCSQNMFCWDNTKLETSVGLTVKQIFILLQYFRLSSNLYFFVFFSFLLPIS